MPVFSSLRTSAGVGARLVLNKSQGCPHLQVPVRHGSGQGMKTTSQFLWNKLKDDFHFFIAIGAIPLVSIAVYANLFIGPAELRDIPEGYVPYDYEYIKHPVSRWLQKNIFPSYEKQYEKTLYFTYVNIQRRKARKLVDKAKQLSRQNQDQENWYFVPVSTPLAEKERKWQEMKKNKFNSD